jgi:hypothetical protein
MTLNSIETHRAAGRRQGFPEISFAFMIAPKKKPVRMAHPHWFIVLVCPSLPGC